MTTFISIHALREEGDPSHPPHLPLPAISIHALREEGDPSFFDRRYHNGRFLSTPSARRATSATPRTSRSRCHFYPRPPRGGRLAEYAFAKHLPEISIHALREEGDPAFQFAGLRYLKFLSTPSARRATSSRARPCSIPCYFYPRPPRGGRLVS